MTIQLPAGPDPATIIDHIRTTFPEADMTSDGPGTFFALDPEKHFPIFATIATTDDYDTDSDLVRPGVFRVNLGVDRETAASISAAGPHDPAAFDRLFPHPTYGAQHWVSILNPSWATWEATVVPLIRLAHDRLAAQRARHATEARLR